MKPRSKPPVRWDGPVRIEQKQAHKRSGLKRQSKTRVKENRRYTGLRRAFLEANWLCQVRTAHCEGRSSDVHHRECRGKKLCLVETFVATCRNCHNWIHRHPNLAREQGWLK